MTMITPFLHLFPLFQIKNFSYGKEQSPLRSLVRQTWSQYAPIPINHLPTRKKTCSQFHFVKGTWTKSSRYVARMVRVHDTFFKLFTAKCYPIRSHIITMLPTKPRIWSKRVIDKKKMRYSSFTTALKVVYIHTKTKNGEREQWNYR